MTTQLQQGIEAARSGDRQTARKLLYQATQKEPDNEKAWGWMYSVCNTDQERIHCLKQVVRINPANEKARQQLERLQTPDPFQTADFLAPPPPPNKTPPPEPKDTTPWYRTRSAYILTFLFLTPVWALLILSDKKQTVIVKTFAAIVAAGYLIYWCLFGLGALITNVSAVDCIAINQSRCTSEKITGIARNTCDRPVELVILRGSIANQNGMVVAENTGFTASDRISPGAISEFSIYLDSSYWDRSNCYLDVENAFFAP